MPHFKKVVGQKCYLSPIAEEDVGLYTKWLNDPEVTVNLTRLPKNITMQGEREYVRNTAADNVYDFGIVDLHTDKLIGNCILLEPDFINRTSELGIYIGDKEFWNRGYGTEAMNLLLDYAFNALNLHSILIQVKAFNKHAIRLYERCGFQRVGRLRDAELILGKRYDLIMMDILADEFKFSVLKDLVKIPREEKNDAAF